MRKALFVTDLENPTAAENRIIADSLDDLFVFDFCSIQDLEAREDSYEYIIIRNEWPDDITAENRDSYFDLCKGTYRRLSSKNIAVYNSMTGRGDQIGKEYHMELQGTDLPVIASIDNVSNRDDLPKADSYIVKPKDGMCSWGFKIVDGVDLYQCNHASLMQENKKGYLVQPVLDIVEELHFLFVDDDFQYALSTKSRNDPDFSMKFFEPTSQEISAAKMFVDWNNLAFGIQRIDLCRTADGQLYLMEIEDADPYLWLEEQNVGTVTKFTSAIRTSMEKHFLL